VEGQQTELPTAPFGLSGFSETESTVKIEWYDVNVNETAFIIERMMDGEFQEVARVNPNANQFTDAELEASTTYEYRISVENKLGISPYSETIEIMTRAPNQEPVPIINASPLEGFAPLEVHFDAKDSFDPDEDELFYTWFIDDVLISNQNSITYTFIEPGVHTVTLELEDGKAKTTASIEINVSEILSVSNSEEVIKIYPNPSTGYFYISSSQEDLQISIFNLSGKHVMEISHQRNELKRYNLPSGVHLLSIRSESRHLNKRIIIR
jgi:PKD repeat protein